tara:strand:- start:840 stop:1109 length:270 start_codon:yes stop_codon:yes gene_type:complete
MKMIADSLLGGIWGFSTISLIMEFSVSGITSVMQLIMVIAGLVYLIFVKFPNDIKMNKKKQIEKDLQNQSLQNEIDDYNDGINEVDSNE